MVLSKILGIFLEAYLAVVSIPQRNSFLLSHQQRLPKTRNSMIHKHTPLFG